MPLCSLNCGDVSMVFHSRRHVIEIARKPHGGTETPGMSGEDVRVPVTVGVDASRNRSGGAKAHLIGLLSEGDPTKHGIQEVHVWAYRSLLDAIPERSWLVKHAPPDLEGGLWRQLWWQRYRLPAQLHRVGCSIVLNTDAGTVGDFGPAVTMSRDMLSYEAGEMQRYGWGRSRLRLEVLRLVQSRSLRRARGVIFLTRYAGRVIQECCGELENIAYIPHGLGDAFANTVACEWPANRKEAIRALYVSNTAMYKHQWNVVRAIGMLRNADHLISLELVGGGRGRAQQKLEAELNRTDPTRAFIEVVGSVPQTELPSYLARAHLFVFASSCENMPNTLIEAMASGLPIACSDRGPMPEVLQDGGVYFDPEDPDSIAGAIERIILDHRLRRRIACRARELASQYSWRRCADETWAFVSRTRKLEGAR